ncbi:AMN1 [Candida oxycetoniae]|uniref:AMN1 n=1 Tax=Candida oxycetoniae TaxID=497107 RepID=A0AAI9SVW2_9ASCO|nr:AMN1 [Candida oxycetoniae]KAI3403661.2 AMN1 [Candida oxycetoniae]
MSYNQTGPLPHDDTTNESLSIGNLLLNDVEKEEKEEEEEDKHTAKKARLTSSSSLDALFANKRSKSTRRKRTGHCVPSFIDTSSTSNDYFISASSSDLESLPDLTDDDEGNPTPETTPIKKTPHKFTFLDTPNSDFQFKCTKHKQLVSSSNLTQFVSPANPPKVQKAEKNRRVSIFEIPEIVYKIISFVDAQNTVSPHEPTPIRRTPLSYNHALLIHGTKELAIKAMRENTLPPSVNRTRMTTTTTNRHPLYNCSLVNKLFNKITSEIISSKFYFHNETQFNMYLANRRHDLIQPKHFNLHKLLHLRQVVFNKCITTLDFQQLETFELFMCPKVYPPLQIFQASADKLLKIVITGSKTVDDLFCHRVGQYCHNLEVVDLRACESITDSGFYSIFKSNHNLRSVNIGRKNKGHLITDNSVHVLINQNRKLHTLGLAGSFISDKILWQIAQTLPNISRLSLNNCPKLTNSGVSSIFNRATSSMFFPRLSVLELCFNLQLIDLTKLIEFKRSREVLSKESRILLLLELCEELMYRMRIQELEMDKLIATKIMDDVLYYVNNHTNDGDLTIPGVLELRKKRRRNKLVI